MATRPIETDVVYTEGPEGPTMNNEAVATAANPTAPDQRTYYVATRVFRAGAEDGNDFNKSLITWVK